MRKAPRLGSPGAKYDVARIGSEEETIVLSPKDELDISNDIIQIDESIKAREQEVRNLVGVVSGRNDAGTILLLR